MTYIRTEVKDEIRIIIIEVQRLVEGTLIEQCSKEIIALLDKTAEKQVLLHFGLVSFMSSSALGMLIKINKKCAEYKVALKLCNITPDIMQVFKITALGKVFSIYPEASDALAAFKKSGHSFFRKHKDASHEVL